MLGKALAGAALAVAMSTTALAAGPLQVTTNFPYPLNAGIDPYTGDLATLGVGSGLDNPDVLPNGATTLNFSLLESDVAPDGFQILSLDLGGTSYAVPLKAFDGTKTLLATVTTASAFSSFVGITDTIGPEPPQFIWGAFTGYLLNADTNALTGIGPFIGDVSTYFIGADHALFEVDVATPTRGVPEPGAWALMIAGFGLAGAQLRLRRALAA
jgi:hypothetical protein